MFLRRLSRAAIGSVFWRCRDIPSLVAVLWATSEEVPLSAMERHFCEAWSVVPLGVSPVVLHGVAWWETIKVGNRWRY